MSVYVYTHKQTNTHTHTHARTHIHTRTCTSKGDLFTQTREQERSFRTHASISKRALYADAYVKEPYILDPSTHAHAHVKEPHIRIRVQAYIKVKEPSIEKEPSIHMHE